jgi:CheY-like chemotaxis protein
MMDAWGAFDGDGGGRRTRCCPATAKIVLIWHPILNGTARVPKILIVEDSPDNMKLFRTLLALKGHDVIGLPGGEGLLDMIEQDGPDLVLMDIQLPGKDGFALLREIRSSPFGTVRVIALTAHAMTGDRERALQAGFDGYITKPIDVRNFPDQVQRALRGERLDH